MPVSLNIAVAGFSPAGKLVLSPMATQAVHLAGSRSEATIIFRPPLMNPPFDHPVNWAGPTGTPRNQLTVPVCPAQSIADTVLLEDPEDASKKLFIPRYRIKVINSQYQMSFEPTGQSWSLIGHLEIFPAPELGGSASGAQPLPLTPALVLQFTIPNTSTRKSLTFQTVTAEGLDWRAELNVASLAERDQLYYALTNTSAATQLYLGRTITAATPLGTADAIGGLIGGGKGALIGGPPGEALYSIQSASLVQIADPNPFYLPSAVNGNIFKFPIVGTGSNLGLQRVTAEYNGASYSYYQDQTAPGTFFYLPDAFKVARKSGSLRPPDIAVRFTSSDGSIENMQGQLDYVALPWLQAGRLAAAAVDLQSKVPINTQPQLMPLQVDPKKLKLSIQLPRADGSIGLQEQTGVQADLVYGISASLPAMSISTFRTVYDALFGASDVLMQGRVEVTMSQDGSDTQVVPFVARVNDLIGDVLDQTVKSEFVDLKVTLRNAIETALTIAKIDATLHTQAGGTTPGFVIGAQLPAQLAPNQTMDFNVAGATVGTTPANLSLKFSGLKVLPDPQATWSAIVDPKQPSEYQKTIHVQAFKPMFDPPPNAPNQQIVAIAVDFERADSVELLPGNADPQTGIIQSDVVVRMPIGSYVLNLPDQGHYRFKVSVIRKDGSQSKDADWQSSSQTILFITTPSS